MSVRVFLKILKLKLLFTGAIQMNCSNKFFIDFCNKLVEEFFTTKMSITVNESLLVVLTWLIEELHLVLI